MNNIDHIVMFSFGGGSWATAKRVAQQHGTDDLFLLFAETYCEDEDTYRFGIEAAADIYGIPLAEVKGLADAALALLPVEHIDDFDSVEAFLVSPKLALRKRQLDDLRAATAQVIPNLIWAAHGASIWEIFIKKRLLGNTMRDPCSDVLKRQLLSKWLDSHSHFTTSQIYIGIDWSESHRYDKALKFWQPWQVFAPLCDAPYLLKSDVLTQMQAQGIQPSRAYAEGFSHDNCGGFCVKAGQGHFKLLLEKRPQRFAWHARMETLIGEYLGRTVSILRERSKGETYLLPLPVLQERIEQGGKIDKFDIGGCACLTPSEGENHATE